MTLRTVLMVGIGLAGVVLAVVLLARDTGPLAPPEQTVALADPSATMLDTVAIRGRRLMASVEARVAHVDATGTVWLALGADAFPARFEGAPAFEVEDRVLATGRLRARGGRRWLAVRDWSLVETLVVAPPRSAPDSTAATRPESAR